MGRTTDTKKVLADRGANWVEEDGRAFVDHFGDADAEYAAIVDGKPGLMERGERETLVIHGDDAVSWLQGLVTSDIHQLVDEGNGQRTTMVNTTGRFVGEARLLHIPELLLLDLEPGTLGGGLLSHLRRQIITEKVTLSDQSEATGRITLFGAQIPKVLSSLTDWAHQLDSRPLSYGTWGSWKNEDLIVQKTAWTDIPTFDLFASAETIGPLIEAIEEIAEDLTLLGNQAFETLRIEAGVPRFGVELHDKVIPLEAGFHDAIAFEKGCYLGQEIIARLDPLGTPANLLRRVILQGSQVPEKGTPVHKEDGEGRKIGDVQSAIYSPKFEAPVALAFVKRKHNDVGGSVSIGGERGEIREIWEGEVERG